MCLITTHVLPVIAALSTSGLMFAATLIWAGLMLQTGRRPSFWTEGRPFCLQPLHVFTPHPAACGWTAL